MLKLRINPIVAKNLKNNLSCSQPASGHCRNLWLINERSCGKMVMAAASEVIEFE